MDLPRQPQMLGDLPLVDGSRFRALGSEYWKAAYGLSHWTAADGLVHLQRLLHKQAGQEGGEGEGEAHSIVLNSEYQPHWARAGEKECYDVIPYHPDILPHWEAFAKAMKGRKNVEAIQIVDIALPPLAFFGKKVMPILKSNNASLTRLEFTQSGLDSDGIASLAKFLAGNSSLSTLDLSYNKIDDLSSAKSLAKAMKKHPELCFVSLSGCLLGENTDVLSTILDGAERLKSLLLEDNGITSEETVAIVADFLAANTSLTVFSLDGNGIGDGPWTTTGAETVLYKGLKKNAKVRELSLGNSGLGCPTAFLRSKRATKLLTHLDLSGNGILTKGAKLIAAYLERNPILSELDLSCNSLSLSAAKAFAPAMKHNTNLQHLNLRRNLFNDKCVPFLAEMLKNNSTLLSLNLMNNHNLKVETGRKQLVRQALCDTTSLDAVANSNHACKLTLYKGKYGDTYETEMRNINSLENEGQKIRYKVVLALFAINKDLFNPRDFDAVPLELMPRLLELVQQEVGYGGFGKGIVESTRKRRGKGADHPLRRLYELVHGWHLPLLFARGAGKLKRRKRKRKAVMAMKEEEDEAQEWNATSR